MNTILFKRCVLITFLMSATMCTLSDKQVREVIEKNPDIIYSAIEKEPEKFIEVLNKAIQQAQFKAAQKAQEDEQKQREEEFKNPIKIDIEPDRPIYGNKEAPVTIVEFTDLECPYCARAHGTLKELFKLYPGKIRLITKHLPLDFHPHAMIAAQYFEAIALQSPAKAFEFKAYVFENQGQLKQRGQAFLDDAAKKVGANLAQVKKDLNNPKITSRIEKDLEDARRLNVNGTPGFFINGVSLRGAYPLSEFKSIIDRHLSQGSK